ncbi:hypothetical protein NDU88_005035 [Pleurodeles waltl]|uniref:Uncharacterized protein n=1 Tax=Pleurodeles waltl TaxID=8319 RepID=A0AAV7NPD9_PLEWA|nr:hypothetical protein NDU88_005035 [Pleurodeles waltl]
MGNGVRISVATFLPRRWYARCISITKVMMRAMAARPQQKLPDEEREREENVSTRPLHEMPDKGNVGTRARGK